MELDLRRFLALMIGVQDVTHFTREISLELRPTVNDASRQSARTMIQHARLPPLCPALLERWTQSETGLESYAQFAGS